jgi:drug/metabolite transporter (DMT)-like permease
MIYLLLSIATSVVTVSFFKLFEKYRVNTFQAIVVNYLVCVIVGNATANSPIILTTFYDQPWFPYALVLGLLFISIFYCIGETAQKMGVSVSMVAAKLSVVVPVLFAIVLHNESISYIKVAGIVLSLISVYLVSRQPEQAAGLSRLTWLLPVLVFTGSGAIDTLLNFVEARYIPPADAGSVVSTVFLIAFVAGLLFFILSTKGKVPFEMKSVAWGAALGIPNYLSMFFLVKTLGNFDASYIFPVNNIGIVLFSTATSIVFFNERPGNLNRAGLVLAVISILILSFL